MGLNCFRRLLPRGSEGAIEKTAQINMTVLMEPGGSRFGSLRLIEAFFIRILSIYSITQWTDLTVPLRISQSHQPLLYLLAPRRRSPTHRRKRTDHLFNNRLSCHLRKTLRTSSMMGIVRKNDLEKLIEVLDKLLQFRWTTHKFLETMLRAIFL